MIGLLSSIGLRVWGYVAAVLAVLAGLAAVFRAGKKSERAKQTADSLDNIREREKVDEEVATRPIDAKRRDLARWVRDK